MDTHQSSLTKEHEIRFQSLFSEGRALSFPCDRKGRVDFDSMSPRVTNNYLFARAMIGREYAMPVVRARGHFVLKDLQDLP
jgi:hypothetical protein